jgi:hypothetical protein
LKACFENRPRLRAAIQILGGPAIALALYLVVWSLFALRAEQGGLLRPAGGIDTGFALLGVAVIGLRVLALFVLPAFIAYRVVLHLLPADTKR